MSKTMLRRALGATAAIAIVAGLSACDRQANDSQMTAATALPALPATLPLDPNGSTAWPTAPEVAALPTAKPLRTARVANDRDYYGYADAAYDYQDVLGDAPPDYYFDYDGVDPWAWEGYDQSVVFLEPIDQGYRYYYYRPGADAPYFVRDPDYGYGYDGDGLAVIYDRYGAVVPYNDYGASRDYAARYYVRGRDMYAASHRGDRRGVSASLWAARQPAIFTARSDWTAARERQPQWRDFHAQAAPRQATYWREEAVRRQADTRRFQEWRAADFRTPPPPRAIPAAWSNARWARDEKRFQPARIERRDEAPPQPQPAAAPRIDAPPRSFGGDRRDARPGPHDPDLRPPAAIRPVEQPRPGRDRIAPQAGGAPRAAPPPRAERQPDRGRRGAMVAPRVDPPQAAPGPPAPRVQAQPRPDRGNRPQFRAPEARVERPQRQPRAEAPRPQPQARIERPQPQARAERPQPQRTQPQAAPAPSPGNGGGNGGGKGGGGKHGGRG